MATPARQQYLDIKSNHPNDILLFRMGDFYETFDDDAKIVAKDLEIALTSREMGKGEKIPLAGIPYHSLDGYLSKLIAKGHRIAICEQTSDPSESKGIVDREVVRIVTPGTVVEDQLLETNVNNYLSSVVIQDNYAGISYVDITTTEFLTTELPINDLAAEINRINPTELIISEPLPEQFLDRIDVYVTLLDKGFFIKSNSGKIIEQNLGGSSLESIGCKELPLATQAAAQIIEYLKKHQISALESIPTLKTYSTEPFMALDQQTSRNLEIFSTGRNDSKKSSLFSILDKTETPMGGRLLRKWLGQPLLDLELLKDRQNAVEWFMRESVRRGEISELLKNISDIERLTTKIKMRTAGPRDLVGLVNSLEMIPDLIELTSQGNDVDDIAWVSDEFSDNTKTYELIRNSIQSETPALVGEGKTIKLGFSKTLDSLKKEASKAKNKMANIESREKKKTGIKSLKIGYNRVFGYYIEVSKSYIAQVPPEYIRRQTLVGGERYVTPEMKEYESIILSTSSKIEETEKKLFEQVCLDISSHLESLLKTSYAVSLMDVFYSMAKVATERNYIKPSLNNSDTIDIKSGRHPVIEQIVGPGEFVPNDANLSNTEDQILLITGPNMSGKSTYLRQVGILTLLAQVGSFIPAESATIGIVDRIFTRVGLQDDLTKGQSTFMVEMLETAYILDQATSKSLIILDEIGRGTSTYDGLAIAQAVAEFIHDENSLSCKTLFATHYHEMTELSNYLKRITNLHVSISDVNGEVTFLRQLIPGGADKSYGIHVAKLAGLPPKIVSRAWEILTMLENDKYSRNSTLDAKVEKSFQTQMFSSRSWLQEELANINVEDITPIEALIKLQSLKNQATQSD